MVCIPARTSHANVAPEQRHAREISDTLVRLSVGIEDPDELWADIERALP